jgi:hypothetical protein
VRLTQLCAYAWGQAETARIYHLAMVTASSRSPTLSWFTVHRGVVQGYKLSARASFVRFHTSTYGYCTMRVSNEKQI